MSLVECFFKEIREQVEERKKAATAGEAKDIDEDIEDELLLSVIKYFEVGSGEKEHWPELVRIILKSKRFSFTPLSEDMTKICDERLATTLPETFTTSITSDQKLNLLETLIDGIHDLDGYKDFLNQRIEERSSYNK